MRPTYSFGVLLLCLVVSLSAAYGQGNCTIKTIVESYAFNFAGSSTIVTGKDVDGVHWDALYAPHRRRRLNHREPQWEGRRLLVD